MCWGKGVYRLSPVPAVSVGQDGYNARAASGRSVDLLTFSDHVPSCGNIFGHGYSNNDKKALQC